MAYFTTADRKKLTLPSNKDYWVEIISDLSYGEAKKFASLQGNGEVDITASADVFLATVIKQWNLDDEDGNVLEINPETIDRLSQQDAIFIINQAGGLVENDQAKKGS